MSKIPKVVSKNVGEWSELYVLMEVADLRKIPMCDASLSPIPGFDLHSSKVFRPEGELVLGTFVELVDASGKQLAKVTPGEISRLKSAFKRDLLAAPIGSEKDRKAKRALASGNAVLNALKLTQVSENPNKKEDIVLQATDPKTQIGNRAGFSIKSSLGATPTLFNASNIRYRIDGMGGGDRRYQCENTNSQ